MVGWLGIWICLEWLLFPIVGAASQNRNFRFVISDFDMKPMVRDLFEVVNWEVINGSAITSYMIFKRNVDQLELDASFDMLRPNHQKLRLYQIRFDGCQFLTSIHKNRLVNLFVKSINQSSNALLKCPFKSHFNYTISKIHMDETDFPQYVPECEFQALTKFYIRTKFVFRIYLKGKVVHKN